ncbi:hypothetical protein P5673_009915 [Acropora cervicornis]|uniref:Uncharacterized protein n=1 Tax=Acropora cervicornis TaxID=6130 RepID=A0AAD9VA47_ACRCE|nr:hypothetical protein P5673_009915 [Acropora cervicornis]
MHFSRFAKGEKQNPFRTKDTSHKTAPKRAEKYFVFLQGVGKPFCLKERADTLSGKFAFHYFSSVCCHAGVNAYSVNYERVQRKCKCMMI